jgi:hypothetical protein
MPAGGDVDCKFNLPRQQMEKRPVFRYDIWSAAQQDAIKADKPDSRRFALAPIQLAKLNDRETSQLLYSYGLPVETALNGICGFHNGQSAKCTTRKISTESVDLVYETSPFHVSGKPQSKIKAGSPVQLNIDKIGAFGGVVASQKSDGVQITVDSSHRSMLSSRLADIAVERGINPRASLAGGPGITRIEPINKKCKFEDHRGVLRDGTIVNLSQVDAIVRSSTVPPTPAIIVFRGPRRYAAEVTSAFQIGFVVSFCNPIPAAEFSVNMTFSDICSGT